MSVVISNYKTGESYIKIRTNSNERNGTNETFDKLCFAKNSICRERVNERQKYWPHNKNEQVRRRKRRQSRGWRDEVE